MNKKQIIFYSIISILFITVLSSCYTNLNLDQFKTKPKVVLNSAISTDTIVMASVSRTAFFTDTSDVCIRNAKVDLYINGQYKEQMHWRKDTTQLLVNGGIYVSSQMPQKGDCIKITAQTPIGTVWASDVAPAKTLIQNIKVTCRNYMKYGGPYYELVYHIKFQDDPAVKNNYCIRIEEAKYHASLDLDYSTDPVFRAQLPDGATKAIIGPSGRAFADDLINGKDYTLTIKETLSEPSLEYGGSTRRIMLYSETEPYYTYLSQYLNLNDEILDDLTSLGFKEPTPLYTNIQGGGTGILGCIEHDTKIIDLKTIIDK